MIRILDTAEALAETAARHATDALTNLLDEREEVRILVATGASQLRFLELLTADKSLDWKRVELFHLDEYLDLNEADPASFARYIRERVVKPTGIRTAHLMDGLRDPDTLVREMSEAIRRRPVDLAFAGIGENGHLAFNDPPADFETEAPYLVVDLDERCRQQQVGEGWFTSLDDVPRRAISISVKQLLQARKIISVVPGKQKAAAVRDCLEGPLSPSAPASALRLHPDATIYLDRDSASLLTKREV